MSIRYLWAVLLIPLNAQAASPDAYQACILKHVKSAKSEIAAQHLQLACKRRNPKPVNARLLDVRPDVEDELAHYDGCLLQHLSTVQTDQSARWMVQFCQDQFHPNVAPSEQRAKATGLFDILKKLDAKPAKQDSVPSAPLLLDGETFVPLVPAKAGSL
ncbi:MAG: hypothetical protein HQL94_07795 [Magnetococcales bacterium]|nr:hypothetical protein [Magnetococcales bacterium]MBF0439504.1 hypothetical protein [Magnetococcales bacterium]